MTNIGGIATENTTAQGVTALPSWAAGMINSCVTPENIHEIFEQISRDIADFLGASNTYFILGFNKEQFENFAGTHTNNNENNFTTASNALTKHVTESGLGVIVENAMKNENFSGDPEFQRFNIQTAICVPLKENGETIGVIYADSTEECSWNDEHLETLSLTGSLAGLIIGSNKLREEMQENYRLIDAGKATLNLSHSVKNILQMVGGAAEVIDFALKSKQFHRVPKSWDILRPNIERLKKFTLDMLDYSKERRLELEACDFNRVIQGSIESLQSQLKQKKSKTSIRVDQNMPLIELDGERIHEMSLNIILNAIDIVEDSGGLVSVETRYFANQEEVLLSITDNGPGMTDEMKEKIFTPFESGKNKFGTGLGMPIAKQIIDQHNGRIEIETEQGKGTTFNIYLPAKIV
jgi:signal transduction histidine kinase